MQGPTWTIIKKELRRVFTDRRLIFTILILPGLSIALMYSIMGNLMTDLMNDIDEHQPVIVMQDAPQEFIDYMGTNEITKDLTISYRDDVNRDAIKQDVANGTIDSVLIFDEAFTNSVDNYSTTDVIPNVDIIYANSENYSKQAKSMMQHVLGEYHNSIVETRVPNPSDLIAFTVNQGDEQSVIIDEKKETGQGLAGILPMLVSIMLFAGAMNVGMDAIAGEKERGTMATMLITPVPRSSIALGKIISISIIALCSTASSFLGIMASMPFASRLFSSGSSDSVNLMALGFGPVEFFQLIVLMLVMVAMYVAMIILISTFAKSMKEAGTFVTPIYLAVMVLSFLHLFSFETIEQWKYAIPIYGVIGGIKEILTFELTWTKFGIAVGVSAVFAAVMIYFIRKMFESERMMFDS